MRVLTEKTGSRDLGGLSHRVGITQVFYFLMLLCVGVILVASVQSLKAQPLEDYDHHEIGAMLKINNQWVKQFYGLVDPVNQSYVIINWYRYQDPDVFKISVFSNPEANDYFLRLESNLIPMNTTNDRIYGSFRVYWVYDGEVIDIDQEDGSIVIRDIDRVAVSIETDQEWRRYEYYQGIE